MTILWIIIGIVVIVGGIWFIMKSKKKPQVPMNPPQQPQGPSSYSGGGTPGM